MLICEFIGQVIGEGHCCGGLLYLCQKFCLCCTQYVLLFSFRTIVSFSTILIPKFLIQLLERHFKAAVTEVGRQQLDIAKQHAATVTATLNAINAYAEWAPLPDLSKYGIIHGYENLPFCS